MDTQTFSYVYELIKIATGAGETRIDIENFFTHLREQFVFDNVAVYIQDEVTSTLRSPMPVPLAGQKMQRQMRHGARHLPEMYLPKENC